MTAKELLCLIQQTGEKVQSNEAYLRKMKLELNSKNYGFIINRISERNKRMPTDFQDSFYYDMIGSIFTNLEKTIQEHPLSFNGAPIGAKPIPLFGTVASSGYNAFIALSDEPVIVFNNDLLTFTDRIQRIYTLEHWLYANKQLTPKVKEILTRNFIDTMVCLCCGVDLTHVLGVEVCNTDNWDEFKEFNIPKEVIVPFSCIYDTQYTLFSDNVISAAYLWIVAHEYAHLLLGHLDSEDHKIVNRYINDIAVEETSFQWQDEFDADFLAASIVMSSDDVSWKISGIYLALFCLNLTNFTQNSGIDSTHPPINQRIDNLMQIIERDPKYLVACKNIKAVISPKHKAFKRFLAYLASANISFSNEGEIQKYIYKEYPLE